MYISHKNDAHLCAFFYIEGRILLCWISRFSFSASNHNILSTKWRNKNACFSKVNSISSEISLTPLFASQQIQIIQHSILFPFQRNPHFALSIHSISFATSQNKDNYNVPIFSLIANSSQEYNIFFSLANRRNFLGNFWRISLLMHLEITE